MPIVRYSNEIVRLNQPNNFQQSVTAPSISGAVLLSNQINVNSLSISGAQQVGSQEVFRPEDFSEIGQVIDYVDRLRQALLNMGVIK